jgi:hypothetical protein
MLQGLKFAECSTNDTSRTVNCWYLISCFLFQEFINFTGADGMDSVEYSQSCKGKNATILGFVWTHNNEIVFVTDHGVEFFQV